MADPEIQNPSLPVAAPILKRDLPPAAEEIRVEIKQMIPIPGTILHGSDTIIRAELLEENECGIRNFGGMLLTSKFTRLKKEMKIDAAWKGKVVYWPNRIEFKNPFKQGYLIPLCSIELDPGGTLSEGKYIYITNEPKASAQGSAILIVPPPASGIVASCNIPSSCA